MGLSPVSIEQFPGLDLRTDPGDSRGAIDLLNVTLDAGRVRTRDGFELLYSMAPAPDNPVFAQLFNVGSTPQLIVAAAGTSPNNVYAISPAGVAVTSAMSGAGNTYSGAAIGTATSSLFFLVTVAASVKQYDGTAWSNPAGFVAGIKHTLGVSPTDNRLAVGYNSATGCRVYFSDPGAPTTFGANNFVGLTPGDGEEIQAMATFNNQLFVFKQTKFFVFYGNSIDATGNPVFNYRTVDTGVGVHCKDGSNPSTNGAYAGARGVYFLSNTGVYRTTGGPPVMVSAQLEPYFLGASLPYFPPAPWSGPNALTGRVYCLDNKVYVSTTSSSGTYPSPAFVLDEETGQWTTLYSVGSGGGAVRGFASLPDAAGSGRRRLIVYTSSRKIMRQVPGATTDDSEAIISRYRLPFESYGAPGRKHLRETILEGTGLVTVQWSKDWGSLLTGTQVQLGTSPAIGDNRQRNGVRGNSFSLQLGASSGAWAVNRVQPNFFDAVSGPEVNE